MINVTVDDHSPVIRYEPPGAWFSGNGPADIDGAVLLYFQNTFMACRTINCSASFQWEGTAIYLFGAKRANHGLYQVTLDGATTTLNGSAIPEDFQSLLFSAIDLPLGLHSVSILNAEDVLYLDVDQITWTTVSDIDPSKQHRVLHTSPALQREPSSAWEQLSRNDSFDGSVLSTDVSNASVSLDFSGVFVDVFGQVDIDAGGYSVQIDNQEPSLFNAAWDQYAPQTRLYYADGLDPGSHKLTITNTPSNPGKRLYIEYVLVSSESQGSTSDNQPSSTGSAPNKTSYTPLVTSEGAPIPSTSTSGRNVDRVPTATNEDAFIPPTTTSNHNVDHVPTASQVNSQSGFRIPPAAAVGISVGAVVFVAILVVVILWWKRWSAHRTMPVPLLQNRRSLHHASSILANLLPPSTSEDIEHSPEESLICSTTQESHRTRTASSSGSSIRASFGGSFIMQTPPELAIELLPTSSTSRVVRANDLYQLYQEKRQRDTDRNQPGTSQF